MHIKDGVIYQVVQSSWSNTTGRHTSVESLWAHKEVAESYASKKNKNVDWTGFLYHVEAVKLLEEE